MNEPPIVRQLSGWRIVAEYRDGKWYVEATQCFWNQRVRAAKENINKALEEIADQSDLILAELEKEFGANYL